MDGGEPIMKKKKKRHGKQPSLRIVLFVDLGIDATNADLIDQMRIMKRGRENDYTNVVCAIRGFNNDNRDLYEIVEVRAFCRRLVCQGFISYLDISTTLPGTICDETAGTWGAAEVYLCSEGRMKKETVIDVPEFLDELMKVVLESNEKCDALIGPMKPPRTQS
jgi:hypothetical protein